MHILGMSSATRKFHNDDCLGATIALAYVIFCWVVALIAATSRSSIPGEIRNLSTSPRFPCVHVERHILILETK